MFKRNGVMIKTTAKITKDVQSIGGPYNYSKLPCIVSVTWLSQMPVSFIR